MSNIHPKYTPQIYTPPMKIKQLQERYQLKTRQSIYNWCEALKINLEKDSNGHSYATPEQIELLDQLAEHLRSPGATLSNFTPVSITSIDTLIDTPIDTDYQPIDTPLSGDIVSAITEVKLAISQLTSKLPSDPLQYMRTLEEARESEWLLTTKELQQLIGVKPKTKKGQDRYKRGCWVFIKSGKIGSQTAWLITKENKSDSYKF